MSDYAARTIPKLYIFPVIIHAVSRYNSCSFPFLLFSSSLGIALLIPFVNRQISASNVNYTSIVVRYNTVKYI